MTTQEQIAGLKYFVFKSPDSSKLGKQILAALLDHSEGMTRTVHFEFHDNFQGYTPEELEAAFAGLHAMQSSMGDTHFGALLRITGNSDVRLWCATGNGRWRCWLGYDSTAVTTIPITRTELDPIDITKPGLYPHLEKVR